MSKQAKRQQHRQPPRAAAPAAPSFTPVAVRARHDGWNPARQLAFVHALAACANVEEACRAVGKSPHSFYDLRRRPDAASFRQAVQAALDVGAERLADRMLARAMDGVVTPIFYKGEQIGERVRYDERLAMFILRARLPERYGKWRDAMGQTRAHPDGAARMLGAAAKVLADEGLADLAGRPRPRHAPLKPMRLMDDPAEQEAIEREAERQEEAEREAEFQRYVETVTGQLDGGDGDGGGACTDEDAIDADGRGREADGTAPDDDHDDDDEGAARVSMPTRDPASPDDVAGSS